MLVIEFYCMCINTCLHGRVREKAKNRKRDGGMGKYTLREELAIE